MNIVVYGGSFDPIHIGHLTVANEIYHHFNPDLFLFIPTGHSPLKTSTPRAPVAQRIAMLNEAIKYLGFGQIETFEIENSGKSYTYHTMKYLLSKYIDANISIVIGTDQYDALNKWYEIEKLKTMVNFIVVNRNTEVQDLSYPFQSFNVPRIDISSTMIRKRIATGKTIKCFVLESIERLIRKEHLYETEES